MRRDPDLERQILLAIEAHDVEADNDVELSIEGHSERQVSYQVLLLNEAGLIEAHEAPDTHGEFTWWLPVRLTMRGHEYLDAIRDEDVWRRTQEGARAAGSFSLEVLGALARGFVREKIRQHTGIDVEL